MVCQMLNILLIFSFSLLNLSKFYTGIEVGTVEYQNPLGWMFNTKKEMTQGLYHAFCLIVNLETDLEIELWGIS